MKILVTGISGFVGGCLARYLVACGDEVYGTYAGAAPELPGIETLSIDIVDAEPMRRAVERIDPEAIIHLAGLSHVGASWDDPGSYFRVNVLGTERLLDAAAGRPVVFASSSEVYGLVPERAQPIGEDRPLRPLNPYALTKAAAERLSVGRGAIVARAFNMIGPGQATHFALPAFASQLAEIAAGRAEPVVNTGNLSARRDFVHVLDGAHAYRLLVEKGEPGQAYNIASGQALSISDALDRLIEISGVEAVIAADAGRLRPTDLPLLCGDPGKLEALGWRREKTVDDALADLWSSVLPTAGGQP
jgi:GDP-4-dehydro-6-deoxy-D-mannose reductase